MEFELWRKWPKLSLSCSLVLGWMKYMKNWFGIQIRLFCNTHVSWLEKDVRAHVPHIESLMLSPTTRDHLLLPMRKPYLLEHARARPFLHQPIITSLQASPHSLQFETRCWVIGEETCWPCITSSRVTSNALSLYDHIWLCFPHIDNLVLSIHLYSSIASTIAHILHYTSHLIYSPTDHIGDYFKIWQLLTLPTFSWQ